MYYKGQYIHGMIIYDLRVDQVLLSVVNYSL